MLDIRRLELPEVVEVSPRRFTDERGFFSEIWSKANWLDAGFDFDFVQDNHSLSVEPGVIRGLHYQLPPHAQDKVVRVTRGAVVDVAVDVRHSSTTFGQWVSCVLSAAKWNQLIVPKGFAHGFMTLEPNTEVQYKVTAPYAAMSERAIRFDDPSIGIAWPKVDSPMILSEKDRNAPFLADAEVFA